MVTKTKLSVKAAVGLIVVVAMLALAPAAVAQNSSAEVYGGAGGAAQADIAAGAEAREPPGGDALPFTGLDLGLAVGGALVLLAAGGAMARLVRSADAS